MEEVKSLDTTNPFKTLYFLREHFHVLNSIYGSNEHFIRKLEHLTFAIHKKGNSNVDEMIMSLNKKWWAFSFTLDRVILQNTSACAKTKKENLLSETIQLIQTSPRNALSPAEQKFVRLQLPP